MRETAREWLHAGRILPLLPISGSYLIFPVSGGGDVLGARKNDEVV
jgi:hypothetical protein